MPKKPLTLEDLDALQASIDDVRAAILEDLALKATIPEPDRPIENPIAQLGRLRAAAGGAIAQEYPTEGAGGVTKQYADANAQIAAPQGSPPSPGGADPLPPPPPPPLEEMIDVTPQSSALPIDDATWRDMMFRPGMAAAMMFVLQPVVEAASDGHYKDLDEVVNDLQAWDRMTIVEQVALTELFAWVELEVSRGEDSLIPPPLRANMQRAYENYQQGSA